MRAQRVNTVSASRFVSSCSPKSLMDAIICFLRNLGDWVGPLNVKENNLHGLISTFLSDGICRVTILAAALFPAYQPLSMAVSFCVIFRVALGSYKLFKNVYCFSDFL